MGRCCGGLVVTLADGVAISTHAPGRRHLRGLVAEPAALAGQEVFIVGATPRAGQAALELAKHASNATMVVRAGSLDANVPAGLAKEIDRTRNIRVNVNTQVVEAFGEGRLEGVRLRHRVSGTIEAARTRALFVMMGADQYTDG